MLSLLILYNFAGLGLVALGLPLLYEKIRPNPYYGFRVAATLSDDRVWYAVNKYAARRLIAAGLVHVAAAWGLYFVPGLSLDAYALGCLAVFGLAFGVGLWQSLRFLREYTRKSE